MLFISLQSITKVFSNDEWGPRSATKYEEWKKFKEQKLKERSVEGSWFKRKVHQLFVY